MQLKVNFIWFLFVIFYLFSLYFSGVYTGGDQIFYQKLYYGLSDNFLVAFFQYTEVLNSIELFYFAIIYFGNVIGFDKNIFMSFFNAALYCVAYRLCYKWYNSRTISFFLVFSCFYLHVLAYSAERFKFSVLMVLLMLIYSSFIKKFVVALFSVLFHVQSSILICAIGLLYRHKINALSIFIVSIFMLVIFILNQDFFIFKFYAYKEGGGFSEIFKTLFFFIASSIDLKRLRDKAIFFGLLSLVCFFIGDERLNVFSFFGYIYFVSFFPRIYIYYSLPIFIYIGLKSLFFFYLIINTGNGFDVL